MAARKDLAVLKAARAGDAQAQLALGIRYCLGNGSLPRSQETALYWLERAARQGLKDAWEMIGKSISYDLICTLPHPRDAAGWYEYAYESGVAEAGRIFARLVMEHPGHPGCDEKKRALAILKQLADHDDHDAQWLLAQHMAAIERAGASNGQPPAGIDDALAGSRQYWISQAAQAGIAEASHAMLEGNWAASDFAAFRATAAPLAQRILDDCARKTRTGRAPSATGAESPLALRDARLLARYAELLLRDAEPDIVHAQRLLEPAAAAGDQQARYRLGLLHARLDEQGERAFPGYGLANYIAAVPWLSAAAEGGLAAAWYALSVVHSKAEFSQRDLAASRLCLERSAEMGLAIAQFQNAKHIWRNRREGSRHDVRALYWWKRAADQGLPAAQEAILGFSAPDASLTWAAPICAALSSKLRNAHPFLCTRLDLAAAFGLTRAEALLVDVREADHGHCMAVDIGKYHARSRRRLILIQTCEQRRVLDLISRLFSDIDAGFQGPEGNYRQRQYRLNTVLTALACALSQPLQADVEPTA
ncbi:hypothetical protein Herbaro_20910 [Herbaspirillum sp. WKF16]|uniref:hypothetical protein n=1 Tax=Herbaspirillum sp. WKF16 TaxID=3028312 RepID=UPI0023A92C8D|nr:hypothetical protein [Herbaspirillum sp. WKF16]WDZ95909.1 hypothetical protein Herbaro_20910 [Herbaspirillum sp. WKF16]